MKYISIIVALLLTLPLPPPAYAGRSFNGTSSIIVAPASGNAIDISTGPTVYSFWMYPTVIPVTNSHYPLSNYGGGSSGQFAIGFGACNGSCSATGVLGFLIGQAGSETGSSGSCGTYTANKWYQVVLYVDTVNHVVGQIVSGGTSCSSGGIAYASESRQSGTNQFDVGGIVGGADFAGIMGEIAIYHNGTLLTTAQMTALQTVCPVGMSARRAGLPNPVAYWPLWGASGTSIEPDLSGHAINGVLTGTAQANHPPCTP